MTYEEDERNIDLTYMLTDRFFVNRIEEISVFKEQRMNFEKEQWEGYMINYYGMQKSGKTALCQKFIQSLNEKLSDFTPIAVYIDLGYFSKFPDYKAYFEIKRQLKSIADINCFIFDFAFIIYCKKSGQEYLLKENTSLFKKSLPIFDTLLSTKILPKALFERFYFRITSFLQDLQPIHQ